jgi:integral membrane sensor domain MASE1
VVGIVYFLAAQLSLALLAEPDGVAVFWPAAGISSGVLIALGRDARLPVAGGAMVATIIASLMGDRNVWSATVLAFCNVGEALLAAWLIERYFGSGFTLGRLRSVLGLVAATAALAATTTRSTSMHGLHDVPVPSCTRECRCSRKLGANAIPI